MSTSQRYTRFDQPLPPDWQRQVVGQGRLSQEHHTLRFVNQASTAATGYSNAQIDDYQHLARRHFPWRAPLRLTLRARFSHPGVHESAAGPKLTGTAGFGFWNDPFLMTSLRPPALPQAIWFFYAAPPSNMKLALTTPGWGWKAATLDASGWPFRLLLPTAPLAIPLMYFPPLHRRLWPLAQRTMKVSEHLIHAPMTAWHVYHLEWGEKSALFSVDGQTVLRCDTPPQGPLGLVIWIDNQFMVVTPKGQIRHGLVGKFSEQWLEVDWLAVEPMCGV